MTGGGEGLEQTVRKGAGVGVGAQLSAEYRRPEASVGHRAPGESASRRPRTAPLGGPRTLSITDTDPEQDTARVQVLGEYVGHCYVPPVPH